MVLMQKTGQQSTVGAKCKGKGVSRCWLVSENSNKTLEARESKRQAATERNCFRNLRKGPRTEQEVEVEVEVTRKWGLRKKKKNRLSKMQPAHETFRASMFPLKDKFFLVSQQEGLQVGGWMSDHTLAKPRTGLRGVRPQVLCSKIRLNG